jgi:cell wall-associated NlpC family hydrolase
MSAAVGRGVSSRAYLGLLGLLLVAGACSGPSVSREDGVLIMSPPAEEAAPSRGAAAARLATRYLGAPYLWGGASPAGFDCSGLVTHVFARVGVSIPHNVAQQYGYGAAVSRARLEPGDLVFFNRLHHNGIYLGEGRFIHATKPGGVKISRLDDDWFRSRWVGARRL